MNYGVIYRAPTGSRIAGLLCGWCHHHGIPALYPTYAEAALLLTRYSFLRNLEGKVAVERILLPHVTENVEVFSGYRKIVAIDGNLQRVVCDASKKSYVELLPLLQRLSKVVSFQKEVGSIGRAYQGSRVVRLKINRTLQ